MPIEPNTMNRDAVSFELAEARNAIDKLIEQVRSGKHDEDESLSPLSVAFQHIMSHLARAWHFKWMSDEDIDALTEAEFNNACDSIPNWGLSFSLVNADEPREFDRRKNFGKSEGDGSHFER